MRKLTKTKILLLCLLIALFGGFLLYQGITTYHAHDTFDGYCKRRRLVVTSTGSEYGYCKDLSTNKEYKIILFKGRRFLDGDLPCGFLCF